MAIVSCSECGASVSTGARSCPNCGYDASCNTCGTCVSYDGEEGECSYCYKCSGDSACPHYTYDDYDY